MVFWNLWNVNGESGKSPKVFSERVSNDTGECKKVPKNAQNEVKKSIKWQIWRRHSMIQMRPKWLKSVQIWTPSEPFVSSQGSIKWLWYKKRSQMGFRSGSFGGLLWIMLWRLHICHLMLFWGTFLQIIQIWIFSEQPKWNYQMGLV